MLESSSVQLKCYALIIQQFTAQLFKKSCFNDTFKFYFLFAFTIVSLIEQSFKCSFTVITFFFAFLFAKSIFFLFNTFCCDNKHDTMILMILSPSHSNFRFLLGSFALDIGDHLRSRIICGPFLGSFVVLCRPSKTITNRAAHTFLA